MSSFCFSPSEPRFPADGAAPCSPKLSLVGEAELRQILPRSQCRWPQDIAPIRDVREVRWGPRSNLSPARVVHPSLLMTHHVQVLGLPEFSRRDLG